MPGIDFAGKRAVVTGGASGVGAGLLEVLAELGRPHVTVLDLKRPSRSHDTFIETDLADPDALEAAIARIEGPVDVLFNNAGVADTSPQDVVIAVNLLAPLRLTQALLPVLRNGGAVVNTGSIAGMSWSRRLDKLLELLALDGRAAMQHWFADRDLGVDTYSFTKEAIQVWTMREAQMLRQSGIRINTVCPTPIDTPLVGDFRKTVGEAGMDFTIAHSGGRMVTPREVASVLAFLGSPAAAFVSGQNLDIDHGFRGAIITGTLDTSSVRASAGRE